MDGRVIEYISMVQPQLEKFASQNDSFMRTLHVKLSTLVKSGGLSQDEMDKIYKQSASNPATVFNYFDVPTFNYRVGKVASSTSDYKKRDPLEEFCLG